MARRKNPPESVRAKWQLADRLRTIRTELFGERGLADLARRIGVPIRTWYSYETGVTVPAEVLLQFIELTNVEPQWLLHGQGPKYQATPLEAEAWETTTVPCPPSATGRSGLGRTLVDGMPSSGQREALLAMHSSGTALMTAELVEEPAFAETFSARIAPATRLGTSCRCIRVEDDAMFPIAADGAFVAYHDLGDEPEVLEGKLVVARVDGRTIVRWFHLSGHYGLLRAENPAYEPSTHLVDLDHSNGDALLGRVLWVGTGHGAARI